MAKILRKNQKVFASSAANNGQFGSLIAGTKVTSTDVETLQALAAYLDGWDSATVGGKKLPSLEEFQTLHYISNYQLAYLFQEGISEWNTDTEYFINGVVKDGLNLYASKTDNNQGNVLTDTANWLDLGSLSKFINELDNVGLDASVAASAMTVTVKQKDGTTDPDSINAATIPVRGDNQNEGSWTLERIESGIDIVVPSGATLGTLSGEDSRLYVYLIKDTTNELAISRAFFDESALQDSVAIDAASDLAYVLYSTNTKSGKPIELIGHIDINQASAGVWASAPDTVFVGKEMPFEDVAVIKDIKSSGTSGGAQNAGVWEQKDLNTQEGGENIVTLTGSDTFFIRIPGVYKVGIVSPVFNADLHKARLYNVTDAAVEAEGSSAGSGGDQSHSTVSTVVKIDSEKEFRVEHRCSNVGANLGAACSFGVDEVYTQVEIRKIR